jgi:DNA-binding transcriptional MerR regulator
MTIEGKFQIGEVADAVGLSIRTIRHYDELGVVEPSGRTAGGFRLYTDADVARLQFVKRLKPMQFSLEEIHEVLHLLDRRAEVGLEPSDIERLEWFVATGQARCDVLRTQLAESERVVERLRSAAAVAS